VLSGGSSAPKGAVFLSYASQDAEAAKRIADALRGAGVEVWFDADGGLETGDEWDAKIRRQIKECVLFIPVVSANTEAREEGYFRIEWDLAAERARGIASGVAFILPVVIDGTKEQEALVPDRFRMVQWTKLPGGVMPPEVLQRFLKLWSHRTGALKHASAEPAARGVSPASVDAAAPAQKSGALRVGLAALGLLLLAAGAYLVLKPRRSPEDIAKIVADAQKAAAAVTPPPAPAEKPAAAAVSEARQLADKARKLFDQIDSNADDYALAESLLKRALELDATDALIWAYSARLNAAYLTRGFERNPARSEVARNQAERAVKLAPGSAEAWHALGRAIWRSDPPRAEEALKHALQLAPDDGRILLSLGSICRNQSRDDEALAYYVRAAAYPEVRTLACYDQFLIHLYQRRFPEAERAVRESIAGTPTTNNVTGLAILEIVWRGRVEAARRVLAEAPSSSRAEPRMVFATALAALMAKQSDEALRALDRIPGDFINDAWYSGPKALFVGLAHLQAGRKEAARIAWEAGLAEVRRRLQSAGNDPELHLRLGELLAWTGQTELALREAKIFEELALHRTDWTFSSARIYAALGRADAAVPILEKYLAATGSGRWPLTAELLRLDPLWDPIRKDPAFQQLLAQHLAVREWPKNPELKKAIELVEGTEAVPDDLSLAEEMTKRVLDRSPMDVEAVTVMARINSHFLRRGFDRSDERAAQAKRYSERALQLAPDEPEAMYALATYHYTRGTGETARTEQLLRRAMELDPTNPRPGRMLGELFNVTNRPQEAIAQGKENVRRFPNDVLTHYDLARTYKDQGLYEEFDRELDATLALAPLANALAWKARLQFGLKNDFAGMKAWLDRVPSRVRGTERAVFGYFIYAVLGGDSETGLAALRDFPQKWFTDFEYAGPTALLNAVLLEQQGKKELARRQYEAAYSEIQRMRQVDPARIGLSQVEFWTLLGLGRVDEAKVTFQRVVEGMRRPYSQDAGNGWWFTVIPGSLLIGDWATALLFMRESIATRPDSRAALRFRFQIDPRMAPFRDDPEIKALLAEPAGATPNTQR
jgi:tetratricopeptide (TPR) repeat protein